MAIQDGPGPTMAATNGPPRTSYSCHRWFARSSVSAGVLSQ